MLRNFVANDGGAVTVDWVVLTAATVGIGLAVMGVVSSGVEDVSGDIDSNLKGITISSTFGSGAGEDDGGGGDAPAYDGPVDTVVMAHNRSCPGAYDPNQSLSAQGCTISFYQIRSTFELDDGSIYNVYTVFDVNGTEATRNTSNLYTTYVGSGGGAAQSIDRSLLPEEIAAQTEIEVADFDITSVFAGGL